MNHEVPSFITARRSIRAFSERTVDRAILDTIVESACLAPAPHHSRPWRFAVAESPAARRSLAREMGERWRTDLASDGIDETRIDGLVAASVRRIEGAPAAVLGCLTHDGLDRYPDARRRQAEWSMALLSLGAAFENLLLAASAAGLAACWVAAPVFCPDTARDALGLPDDWQPQAMALVGYPDPSYRAPDRRPIALDTLRVVR